MSICLQHHRDCIRTENCISIRQPTTGQRSIPCYIQLFVNERYFMQRYTLGVSIYVTGLKIWFVDFIRLKCIYVCPTSAHRGFRYGYRRYKGNTFTLKTTLFGWQSMALRSDLTLLNINMSKNSTFAWFFLLKSLYYQWLFVSLHRQFPPSLSTILKCVGLFCIYTFTLKIH